MLGSLLFYKVAGLRFQNSCFPVNFAKSLRTRFFTEHLRTSASVARAWFEESEKKCLEHFCKIGVLNMVEIPTFKERASKGEKGGNNIY